MANAQGKAIQYTRVMVGDGQFNGDIDALTSIISPKLNCPLHSGKAMENGQFQLNFVIDNGTVKSGFYAREIGIYAKIDGADEVLFAYTNGGNYVDYIPNKSIPIDAQVIEANIIIGDAEKVEIVKSDSTYATVGDLLLELDSNGDLMPKAVK